jgi:hypothetical protein
MSPTSASAPTLSDTSADHGFDGSRNQFNPTWLSQNNNVANPISNYNSLELPLEQLGDPFAVIDWPNLFSQNEMGSSGSWNLF